MRERIMCVSLHSLQLLLVTLQPARNRFALAMERDVGVVHAHGKMLAICNRRTAEVGQEVLLLLADSQVDWQPILRVGEESRDPSADGGPSHDSHVRFESRHQMCGEGAVL